MLAELIVTSALTDNPPAAFDPVGAINGLIATIETDPGPTLVRGGISLLVVVVAFGLGRWLARTAGRVPVRVETKPGQDIAHIERKFVASRSGVSRWLSRLTRASIWIAAIVALVFIWLSGQGGFGSADPKPIIKGLTDVGARLGISLVVLAFSLGVGRILERGMVRTLDRSRVNPNIGVLSGRVIYVATLAVGLVVILAVWGTGVAVPVALLGAMTVALSISLQDVLKNLVSGVYLLIEGPFVIGDRITLTPYTGEVEDIQIRYTALRTTDNQRVLVPNSMLFSSAVINLSAYDRRRAGLTVTVPDGGAEGVDRVEELIRAAVGAVPGVLSNPEPQIILSRATAGKIELQVVFWTPTKNFSERASTFSQVIEQVRAQVKDAEVAVLDTAASGI